MASTPKRSGGRADQLQILQSITTPLGFFVLALLIIETTLSIVLSCSKLSEPHVWDGVIIMLALFGVVVLIVTIFTWLNPRHLLYGKEEHVGPTLEPSALKDQIADVITAQIKPECLKSSEPGA